MEGDKLQRSPAVTRPLEDKFCCRCFEFLTVHPDISTLLATWDTAGTSERDGTKFISYKFYTNLGSLHRNSCELCKIFFNVHHDYSKSGCFGAGSGQVDWWRPRTFEAVYYFKEGAKPLDFHQIRFQEAIHGDLRRQRSYWLNICAYPDDPAARFISTRPIMLNLWSADHLRLACGWIEDCLSTHDACPKIGHGKLPTRVIDVCSGSSPNIVRLYLSAADESASYATLSYCWGTSPQPVILTKQTMGELLEGIPTSKLPQTIVDAIHVTRKLGLKYLWVDALCIIQDSDADKIKEITKMARIYQQSYVTIAAANADAVGKGFIHAKGDYMHNPSWHNLPFSNRGTIYGSAYGGNSPMPPSDLLGEPLHKRGWTLQEHVLSPRVLTFDSYRLGWDCNKHHCTEGDTSLPPMRIIQFAVSQEYNLLSEREREGFLKQWTDLLQQYTGRQLTDPDDRLPAISAIAQQFAIPLGRYVAGLWENFLLLCLQWRIEDDELDKPSSSVNMRKPSWSWSSTDHEIRMEWLYRNDIAVEMLKCSVTLDCEDSPFGKVTGGLLVIRGTLAPATRDNRAKTDMGIYWDHAEDKKKDRDWSQAYFLYLGRCDDSAAVNGMYAAFGLLLESQPDERFRRMGFFRRVFYFGYGEKGFEDERKATVSII